MSNPQPVSSESPKRALVTGANGFIGSALTLRLLRDGVAVRALCRDTRRGAHLQGAELVQGDVQDADLMQLITQGCDVVYHVAAAFTDTPPVMYRVNVLGTLNVAEAALAAGVARLVHVSSIAVYGLAVSGVITEDHPQHPSPFDYYQESKQVGEERLWAFARRTGLPVSVIRPAMVYGPQSGFWSGALYQLICRLPRVPQLEGDAHPIYIEDVVDLMVTLAAHPAAVGEAFHCAPDPSVPWNRYLDALAQIAGNAGRIRLPLRPLLPLGVALDWAMRFVGTPRDIAGSMRLVDTHAVYRMQKARERLGWSPRFTLEAGMAATRPWLLEQFGTRTAPATRTG